MTRFLLLLFCVTMIIACKPGIPKDIVQPAEMENILFDIHIVDGYVSTIPIPDSARKISAPIYKGIFKKYGIDSAMHAKSMAYYYRHPDILEKIYNKISEKLTKTRDAETQRLEKEAKLAEKKALAKEKALKAKVADSIKKALKAKKEDSLKKLTINKQVKPVKKVAKTAKK